MNYPIHVDTICMDLSILYFNGLPVKFSVKWGFSYPEDCFIIAKVQTLVKRRSGFKLKLVVILKNVFKG